MCAGVLLPEGGGGFPLPGADYPFRRGKTRLAGGIPGLPDHEDSFLPDSLKLPARGLESLSMSRAKLHLDAPDGPRLELAAIMSKRS